MKNSKLIRHYITALLMSVLSFKVFSIALNLGPIGNKVLALAFAALFIVGASGYIEMPKSISTITTFYTPSDLATGQALLVKKFASAAKKAIQPETFLALRRNAEISMPDFKVLRTREDRPLAAYFMLRTLRALGNGRSFNATGATGTSGSLVPAYTTYSDPFSISMKLMGDNVISWAEMLANEFENSFKNFSEGNEANATTYLYNNRSQVNVAVANGAFNNVTNTFEVTESTYGQWGVQITDSMMAENRWQGYSMTIFCDTTSYNRFARDAKQGEGNYQNTSFQFEGKTYVRSLLLTAKAQALGYTKGFWFAVPDGTVAALDWIPQENRTGFEKAQWKWFPIDNPIDGITYAGFEWVIGTDTFTNSVAQDLEMNYQISLDIAFEYAPLTTAGETPIQAVALV